MASKIYYLEVEALDEVTKRPYTFYTTEYINSANELDEALADWNTNGMRVVGYHNGYGSEYHKLVG